MSLNTMPVLKIGQYEMNIPIIQGGMSVGISLSGLASAVANEGGIGVIGAAGIGMFEPDVMMNPKAANQRALRKEIQKAKKKSQGFIGVNIMVALSDYEELALVSVEEGIDFIFLGAGLPLKIPKNFSQEHLEAFSKKVIPIVSSDRALKIIFRSWGKNYGRIPDAVVVEGPLAGGHLGFKLEQINDPEYRLENLVKQVMEGVKPFEDKYSKKISVIAAGGIYTGADIYKFLNIGVDGVQMATRFVATYECDADDRFKEMYVNARKEDLVIIKSPVGLPGRAIKNEFLLEVKRGERIPFKCPWKCLKTCDFKNSPYCIALALTNAKKGILSQGFSFAGANAYKIDRIVSVKELINTLKEEYLRAQEGNS